MSDLLPVSIYFGPNEKVCAICREMFRYLDTITTLECKHKFHYKCIEKWIDDKGTCPYCRNHDISSRVKTGKLN